MNGTRLYLKVLWALRQSTNMVSPHPACRACPISGGSVVPYRGSQSPKCEEHEGPNFKKETCNPQTLTGGFSWAGFESGKHTSSPPPYLTFTQFQLQIQLPVLGYVELTA